MRSRVHSRRMPESGSERPLRPTRTRTLFGGFLRETAAPPERRGVAVADMSPCSMPAGARGPFRPSTEIRPRDRVIWNRIQWVKGPDTGKRTRLDCLHQFLACCHAHSPRHVLVLQPDGSTGRTLREVSTLASAYPVTLRMSQCGNIDVKTLSLVAFGFSLDGSFAGAAE